MNETSRPCAKCKGTAIYDRVWNGSEHTTGTCPKCKGTGQQSKPDVDAIINLITKPNKATGKRAFRKSKPKLDEFKNRTHGHAYYVWRLARFHGGADVTMPMVADLVVGRDAWKDVLDTLSEEVAKRAFGTDLAAAYRWGNALGHSLPVPAGMPASAYPCGPVADGNKPEYETAELF